MVFNELRFLLVLVQLKIESLKNQMDESNLEKSFLTCDCKPSCAQLQFNIETSHSDFSYKTYFQISKMIDEVKKTKNFENDEFINEIENNTEYVEFLKA